MTEWIAVSNGALLLEHASQVGDRPVSLALLPISHSEPIAIADSVSELWLSLTHTPVDDSRLSPEERSLIREFAAAGIASPDLDHLQRVNRVEHSWFESFQHELVCSLVTSIARGLGIRCLIIKGPTLHAQGLRRRVHSGDVDLLVDPRRIVEFVSAMNEWGWDKRPHPLDGTPAPHSHTLLPIGWGCEIDVHVRYPGITIPSSTAFDLLWQHSEERFFAGVGGRTPTKAAHALIQGLTIVRPVPGRGRPRTGANPNAVEVLRAGGEQTLSLAIELGSHGALADELKVAFPGTGIPKKKIPAEFVWLSQANHALLYLRMLQTVPLRDKPLLFWKVISHRRSLAEGGRETLIQRWRRGFAESRRNP
ncbi:nucleotidyltransferase family protein [Leucobacter sp. wl10]|uniref:nucleotidyltransferase family protein n=1 Tax=Leucobacter sp. wl10 TaxID=2304677 RepID=UPI0013C333B2|nr:nucleotidyltransferase family protein [Leucobacter sp. wl10]